MTTGCLNVANEDRIDTDTWSGAPKSRNPALDSLVREIEMDIGQKVVRL